MEPMTQPRPQSESMDRGEVLMINLVNARANAARRADPLSARTSEAAHRLNPRTLRPAVQ